MRRLHQEVGQGSLKSSKKIHLNTRHPVTFISQGKAVVVSSHASQCIFKIYYKISFVFNSSPCAVTDVHEGLWPVIRQDQLHHNAVCAFGCVILHDPHGNFSKWVERDSFQNSFKTFFLSFHIFAVQHCFGTCSEPMTQHGLKFKGTFVHFVHFGFELFSVISSQIRSQYYKTLNF